MIMYGITYWLAADERFYNLTSLPTVDDILHVYHQQHMLLTLYITKYERESLLQKWIIIFRYYRKMTTNKPVSIIKR